MLNFNMLVATDSSVESQDMQLSKKDIQLIHFLQEKLTISASSIAVALRRRQQASEPLPIILWQYGLVSIQQLDRIFEWQERNRAESIS